MDNRPTDPAATPSAEMRQLAERVKELKALHAAALLLGDDERPLPDLLRAFVACIPPAMQFPDSAAARVLVCDLECASPNYRPTPWQLEAHFKTKDGVAGLVQVVYLGEHPPAGEGPFLIEERNLLNSLAEMLRLHVERRQAAHRLARLNRLYQMLSRANEAIVRAASPAQLFTAVCRSAVEHGSFRMAAIVELVADTGRVQPVAHHGAERGYFANIAVDLNDARSNCGTIGTAMRTGRPDVCNDFDNEPRMAAWREEALRRGYRSTASFPIRGEGHVTGALVLFAGDAHYFQQDEIELLQAVADDVSFALEALRREQQRLRAEVALRASEASMAAAQRIAHFGSWELELTNQDDLDANPLRWSDEMYRILGFEPGSVEVGNELFFRLVHPDDRASVRDAVATAIRERGMYSVVHRVLRPDGQERIVHETAQIFFDGISGRPLKMIGTAHDITEQRRAENQVRESEERFRLLSRATNDAIWDWDLVTDAAWWNEGFEAMFGYSRDEVEPNSESWTKRIHPEDRERIVPDIHRVIEAGGDVWSGEYRFLCKDGRYAHVLDRGYVIRDAAGRPVRMIGGMTDLTERKNLQAQLLQSQKMEAVGQLAGGVAHDFNNLLTVISGYSDVLLTMLSADDPKRTMVADIRDAGERAANLTRQLLAFSRKQILAPQIVDINAVVSNIERMLRRLIGEDIRFTSVLRPDLHRVKVDPGQLEQVIINLAVNARDAMPGGGRLTIETANVVIDAVEAVQRLDFKPGSYVALTVSDTGHGMTEAVKAHIFEPFFTTKEPGKGTGLGLATVFGIIKQSEGLIEVFSEAGRGARFRILLPAVTEAAKRVSHYDAHVFKGTETVLLVEDDEGVRQIARLALETQGYHVLQATNGREALDVIASYPGPVHLVITDVVMPEMSGRQLVEHLRSRPHPAKVLFMSGHTDDAIVRHGIIEAVDAFLQKPFTPLGLARKVRQVLDS